MTAELERLKEAFDWMARTIRSVENTDGPGQKQALTHLAGHADNLCLWVRALAGKALAETAPQEPPSPE